MAKIGKNARQRRLSLTALAAISLPLASGCIPNAGQGLEVGNTLDRLAIDQLAFVEVAAATDALVSAPQTGPIDPMRGWSESDVGAYAAWWDNGYNYEQLLALADEWDLSEFEAKGQAGRAILAGDTSDFDAIVADIAPPG